MLIIPDAVKTYRTRHRVLIHLIRMNRWTHGAELGVMSGKLFFLLLEQTHLQQLIGVDIWKSDAEYEDRDMPAIGEAVREKAKAHGDRAVILHADTVEAAESVPDKSLDFVFVDAKHDLESVRRDLDAWQPKLKQHGYMMGHDIDWGGVRKAVSERYLWQELPGKVWVGLARQC
jgi:predicted O-methyltransferase YrrM